MFQPQRFLHTRHCQPLGWFCLILSCFNTIFLEKNALFEYLNREFWLWVRKFFLLKKPYVKTWIQLKGRIKAAMLCIHNKLIKHEIWLIGIKPQRFFCKNIFTFLLILALLYLVCAFLMEHSSALSYDLSQEMTDCARALRFPLLSDKLKGYNFGYGSLNDTDFMCR